MTRSTKIATVAALVLAGGMSTTAPALAEGYSVRDFREVMDRPTCMSQGENALRTYVNQYGGGEVIVTDWVLYAWDFRPGNNDIVLMCPVVSGGVINAFFVIHGETNETDRNRVADEVERLWNAGASIGGKGKSGKK